MTSKNYVLRSVYLDPALDKYLRERAFVQKISKNDLIRQYLVRGAEEELADALVQTPSESPSDFPSTLLHAAKGASLLRRATFLAKQMKQGTVLAKIDASAPAGTRWLMVPDVAAAQRSPTKKSAAKAAKRKTSPLAALTSSGIAKKPSATKKTAAKKATRKVAAKKSAPRRSVSKSVRRSASV